MWRSGRAAHLSRPPSRRTGAVAVTLGVLCCEVGGRRPVRRCSFDAGTSSDLGSNRSKRGPGTPLGPLSDPRTRAGAFPLEGSPLGLPGSGGFAPLFPPSLGGAGRRHPTPAPLLTPQGSTIGIKGATGRYTLGTPPHLPPPVSLTTKIAHRDTS